MANAATTTPAATPVDFEVFLPLRNPTDLQRLVDAQQTPGSASYQKWVTPAQYKAQFGPTAASWAKAEGAFKAAGFTVTTERSRSFHVTGTAGQAAALFQTALNTVADADGKTKIVAGKLNLPAALASEGAKVVAFANLPSKRPYAMKADAIALGDTPDGRQSAKGPYWPNDMKQAYDYPSYQSFLPGGARVDGTGVHAAVLMEDLLYPGDEAALFNHEHFTATTGKAPPVITTVKINGGGAVNGPGSFEAALDVQQISYGAPGAQVTLFSIPNLADQNIVDGYTAIVDSNQYDIVNSSFGGCELTYTAAYNGGVDYTWILQIYEEIFQQGNAQGITFVASSGDQGGPACPTPDYFTGGQHPHFVAGISSPSDSPSVTAVGGGNLVTVFDGTLNSAYVSENGFGDPEIPYDIYGMGVKVSGGYWGPGGGVSSVFARPGYQTQVNTGSTTFRTNPDVGMQVGGCPSSISIKPCGPNRSAAITAFAVGLGGGYYGVIGTSVSSPEFVGAAALWLQKTGKRQGNINTYLYHYGMAQTLAGGVSAPASAQYYHRNIDGFNGLTDTNTPSKNYNYINGNGTPDVRKLFGFSSYAPAGIPQSASNP